MKRNLIKLVGALCIAAPFVWSSAFAADKEMSSQQSKMATCNKDAAGMKGDDRKAFMKTCLSANKKMTQQEKMSMCNKDATGKKGDDRKAFMSDCLKG